jgi:DNA polymerase (family 10)
MKNSELASQFERVATLMELVEEDPFRIKAYRQAADALYSLSKPVQDLIDSNHLHAVPGLGKGMVTKIQELLLSGTFPKLMELEAAVPEGVLSLTMIRGLGPKKVKSLWKEHGIQSPEALERAALDGSLARLKGFGSKTVASLLESLRIWRESQGQLLLHHARKLADQLKAQLMSKIPTLQIEARNLINEPMPVVNSIELETMLPVSEFELLRAALTVQGWLLMPDDSSGTAWMLTKQAVPVQLFIHTATDLSTQTAPTGDQATEPGLIEFENIRGVIHAHSTWSDGIDDLRSLALACRDQGFDYLAITDHSRTAAYAGGLSIDRVLAQWDEIDRLNAELAPFVIFKGIESDILADGSLDYPDELLEGFDLVISSIHSGFNMSEAQATERLVRAACHPATSILGHPTGRLLLKRAGYPIDHKAVIDACAACGTAIELNCNPYRMDLDWTWIEYAQSCGVPIAINPDAHRIYELGYLHEGVLIAKRGGLLRVNTLNAKSTDELRNWLRGERMTFA